MMKLFDAHCHLQDPRISSAAPVIIRAARELGVRRFAVNGTNEKDWHLVKKMAEDYPSIVPCFGLHPWFITERTPNWMETLKELFAAVPAAAVGEIGIDKGSHGKTIEFSEQVEVFRQQVELAKDLERPVSVHCVRAFGDLLETLQHVGPFPSGVILHSYLGSAEMVPELAKLGCYFSFSGFLLSMKMDKAKKMLEEVPLDRILLETDCPDAFPKLKSSSPPSFSLKCSTVHELLSQFEDSASDTAIISPDEHNHPANIHTVLNYVATLLDMPEEKLAEASYSNTIRLFSYPGSGVHEGVSEE